jgi:hypothetical protein
MGQHPSKDDESTNTSRCVFLVGNVDGRGNGMWIPCEKTNRLEHCFAFFSKRYNNHGVLIRFRDHTNGIRTTCGDKNTAQAIRDHFLKNWTHMRLDLHGMRVVSLESWTFDEVPDMEVIAAAKEKESKAKVYADLRDRSMNVIEDDDDDFSDEYVALLGTDTLKRRH